MRNAHDVGGMLGFGPIVRGDGEAFHADWERLAFGLTLASIANGFLRNVDENRYAKERMRPQDLASCSYYELWLAALELNLVENGVLDQQDIERVAESLAAGTSARPEAPEPASLATAIDKMIAHGGDTATETSMPRQFQVDDTVVIDPANTRDHSRVPVYAVGRRAVVVALRRAHPVPGAAARGGAEVAWCYTVRFEARVLWGEGAERADDGVYLDVWEPDMRPARDYCAGQV